MALPSVDHLEFRRKCLQLSPQPWSDYAGRESRTLSCTRCYLCKGFMTKIHSIRVLSAAKVNGVLYGILGLLIAPLVLLGPGLAVAGGERRGFGGAVVLAIFLPFVFACVGFIAGALLAFIYNAISHAIGGLELELLSPAPPSVQADAPAAVSAVHVSDPPSPDLPTTRPTDADVVAR